MEYFPSQFFFTKDHEWISHLSGAARVGISAFAVEQLGDIVHCDLPKPGSEFTPGTPFGTVESTKTVSDLYMPVHARVTAVNSQVLSNPELIQKNPYTEGWLIQVELLSPSSPEALMDKSTYETYCGAC